MSIIKPTTGTIAKMMTQRNTTMKNKPLAGGLQNISPKVMIMVALLAVMAILWGRVLLKGQGGPAAANAQDQTTPQPIPSADASDRYVEIEPVQLSIVPGRHDHISNDIFAGDNWTAFGLNKNANVKNGGIKVNETADPDELVHRASLGRIAERLTLEAVICDSQNRPFQAFVEDKILTVGATLTVQEGPDQFELKLEKINEKDVVFSWNGISVMLKMAETFEL